MSDGNKELTLWAGNTNRSDQFKKRITFSVWNGSSWKAVKDAQDWQVGKWYHLVAVRSGNSAFLYIDTQLISSVPDFYADPISGGANAIGYKRQSNDNFANISL